MFFNEPLCRHSTIFVGGKALAWAEIPSVEGLVEAKRTLKESGVRSIVVGNCSNLLFPDGTLEAVVIRLSGDLFSKIVFRDDNVTVGAGVSLGKLISACCERGLSGLEGLIGIPATVGGALINNASYLSAISDRLAEVHVLDEGFNDTWIKREDIEFGYRYSSLKGKTVIEAVFKLGQAGSDDLKEKARGYFNEKMLKQPLDERSLGCVFKTPEECGCAGGEIIDKAGMKGAQIGGAKVSEKNANFIINTGDASSADVMVLMENVIKKVFDEFSIELKPEIEIIKN